MTGTVEAAVVAEPCAARLSHDAPEAGSNHEHENSLSLSLTPSPPDHHSPPPRRQTTQLLHSINDNALQCPARP